MGWTVKKIQTGLMGKGEMRGTNRNGTTNNEKKEELINGLFSDKE